MHGAGGFGDRRAIGLLAVLSITALLAAPAHAAFPGVNGKIAFVHFSSSTPADRGVWAIDADGTNRVQLTSSPSGQDIQPDWSPNGKKIVFVSERDEPNPQSCAPHCDYEIYAMNADGSNQTRLTHNPGPDENPAWSPDGTKIAFTHESADCDSGSASCNIYVMNADGSNQTDISIGANFDLAPTWSPDGKKIAFSGGQRGLSPAGLFLENPDGTNQVQLTSFNSQSPFESGYPNWSPNGSKITFGDIEPSTGTFEIYGIDANGSNRMQLTNDASSDKEHPVWSPDGTKIAFELFDSTFHEWIYTINPDGSGATPLSIDAGQPAWQPIPINYYPRPKGATPFQTYLTVAYKPCASANERHGAPLAALSCSPPVQASDYLTVGTMDANGEAAKSVGSVRYDVKPGNPSTPTDEADVKIAVSIKDVRNKDLSDYTGELAATSTRRITDKNNTPAPNGGTGAATTADFPFSATIPCASTTDATIGSLCELTTTADAVVLGQVKENVRSIWQLAQVQVYDGGADADADTTADNTLFMDEGIFVP